MTGEGFVGAVRAIKGGSLATPCLWVLPVTGAAVAVLGSPMHSGTSCATDGVATRIDEVQFDLGEGPAWAAVGSARPVFIPDVIFRSALQICQKWVANGGAGVSVVGRNRCAAVPCPVMVPSCSAAMTAAAACSARSWAWQSRPS